MFVYDIEIAKCIPPRKGKPKLEYEYCEGWNDHEGMGISSICSYLETTSRYNVFMEDNMYTFKRMLQTQLQLDEVQIVGFNNMRFDNLVIHANELCDDLDLLQSRSYDLLQEIWRAVTGKQEYVTEFDWKVHAGYGLDAMCAANFSENKSGIGSMAPEDFQNGNYGSLIDYNLNDVRLTWKLFQQAYNRGGKLITPKNDLINLRSPEAVLQNG